MLVTRLTDSCRLMEAIPGKDATTFSTRLQTTIGGRWVTIACYEARLGQVLRHVYRPDGTRSSTEVDLPCHVVKEMAACDLGRNWDAYVAEFGAADRHPYHFAVR